jgi:hypothetical protein
MDGQDGVPGVVLVEEQGPEFAVGKGLFEAGQGRLDVGPDVLSLGEELGQDLDLILLFADSSEELEVALEALLFLLERLGGLLVLPDLRRREALVDRVALGSFMIEVKESPAALRTCRSRCRGVS